MTGCSCTHQNGDFVGKEVNVEFDVKLHAGDMYYMIRPMDPPMSITPPYRYIDAHHGEVECATSFCNIENYPAVNR